MIKPAAVVSLLLTVSPIAVQAQSVSTPASNESATQHPKNSLAVHYEGSSPSDAISIGSTTLKVGMSKDDVLSELGKHYLLENPIPTDWYIHPKSDNSSRLGGVRFSAAGKLSAASKVWTPEEKEYNLFHKWLRPIAVLVSHVLSELPIAGEISFGDLVAR